MKPKIIVVTGGAGYIGSYVVHNLLLEGFGVIVIDNLSNGDLGNISPQVLFYQGDFSDSNIWNQIIQDYDVAGVIHLAAYIEVEESIEKPNKYFVNNSEKTRLLLQTLDSHHIKNLVFASTCAVYGNNENVPITEQTLLNPLNPYAESKLKAEQYIHTSVVDNDLSAIIFRFFNTSGTLDELKNRPKNQTALLPQILKAVNTNSAIKVFGNDYETKDGSCIRDFVHVYDIARACVIGMKSLLTNQKKFEIYNIGSEHGYSVLEIIKLTESLLNKKINVVISNRRADEVVVSVASSKKLQRDLNFEFKYSDIKNIIQTFIG